MSEMMGKCPMRRPQSCGLLDVQLGFVLGVDDVFCERCHELGPGTQQALEVRTGLVQLTVDQMKPRWPNIGHPGLRDLVGKAMSDGERAAAASKPTPTRAGPKKMKWLGLTWEGVPYPWLLGVAVVKGVRTLWAEVRRVGWPWSKRATGCGCLSAPKRALAAVTNTLSGGNSK
ncbi:MAG: hypothetical protein ACK4Y5_20780 [Acetobacteraceae bacterium]|jgi:hypothetical protein